MHIIKSTADVCLVHNKTVALCSREPQHLDYMQNIHCNIPLEPISFSLRELKEAQKGCYQWMI